MKIYLDDERDPPNDWVRCAWPDEVIALLHTDNVTEISLDHDLGDDQRGTGYDVLLWIEEAVADRGWRPPIIHVHSANSFAVRKMDAAIAQIHKLAAAYSDYSAHWERGRFLVSWDGSKPAWYAPETGEPVMLEKSAETGSFFELSDGRILGADLFWQCYRPEFVEVGWRRSLTMQPMAIWSPRTGARERELFGHHFGSIVGAEVLGDERLVTWGRDYLIRIWDYASGECRGVLPLPLWSDSQDQQAIISSQRFSALSELEKREYVDTQQLPAPDVRIEWIVSPGNRQYSFQCRPDTRSETMSVSRWVPTLTQPGTHRVHDLEGAEAGYSSWLITDEGRLFGGGTAHGTTGYFYVWDGYRDLRILIAGGVSSDVELRAQDTPNTALIDHWIDADRCETFEFQL